MGGSLAILLGYELAISEICNPNIYTFGSPKVGNIKFKERYNEVVRQSIRFVNLYDVVPLLPPFKVEISPININLEYVQVQNAITFAVNKGSISKSHHLTTYLKGVIKMKQQYDYTPTFTYKLRDEDEILEEQV